MSDLLDPEKKETYPGTIIHILLYAEKKKRIQVHSFVFPGEPSADLLFWNDVDFLCGPVLVGLRTLLSLGSTLLVHLWC